ncbi:MAG: HEAT repeat domain-containing protein [Polyangiaceae bacterium]|nr:HEAT repeat domain-containing protein [Polyangiaceae bacterium]
MNEPNKLVRRSAVQDLARHAAQDASPEIVSALQKALRDEDPFVRREAAYTLGDTRVVDALPALLLAVDDPHSGVRQAAIDALGQIGDPRATVRLQRALNDDRPDVRFQAIMALARVSKPDGVSAVLRAVEDDDAHIRYVALRTAEELCASDHHDTGITLRLEAWVEEAAARMLMDDSSRVRLAASILLARSGSTAGASILIDAIENRFVGIEPEDVSTAIELAGELGLREAIPGLERRAFGWKRLVIEQHAWLSGVALARLGQERAKRQILRDLQGGSRNKRTLAAMAAGRAKLAEAGPLLERMRGDDQAAEPEAVDEALKVLQSGSS